MELSVQGKSWPVGILVLLVAGVGAFAQTPTALSEVGEGNQQSEAVARNWVSDHERLAAMQPPDPSSLEAAPEIVLKPIELASFELSNGSTVKLLAVPELGELGYTEVVHAGAEPVLPGEGEMSPLEVFLALAPVEAPIPRALIDLDTRGNAERLAAGRERTDRASEPVAVEVDDLGLRNQAGASGSCGSGGSSYFASNYCGYVLGHDCKLISFCDSGSWSSLTRSSWNGSWQAREASYGRTAACGTSVQIKQQYWVSSAWVTLSTQTMASGEIYISSWHGSQAYRRIVRVRLSSSGYFRAYTNFHNDGFCTITAP